MKNFDNNSKIIHIENELKKSYLDYAMSVIISRALPDVRDGLKPVHRRILYAMNILNNYFNKPYKKSARIVGDVIGKYHPHGDNSVYDAIVRMAQKFSLRYTLIDGQGNFGSIDGDPAAAMRYTEIRMSKISHELLLDLEKETVDFELNYDNSEYIPSVLPSKIPNLLINGSYGIAVGVATNIPPHNISEVINGCLALIKDENISTLDLMKYIPGPDFPTSAIIHGKKDIEDIYNTGKGKICIKSRTKIEKNYDGNESIIIEEIPYQTNKIKLIEKISELVKLKKINGINNIRDESNQKGIRIVINLKKDSSSEVILNNLYSNSPLQTFLHVNMVALDNFKPKLMSLKEILIAFIKHRENIIYRRTFFLLKKYNKKIHILEGFIIAINNIEKIINIIKNSYSVDDAKSNLSKIKCKPKNSFLEYKSKYNKIISNKDNNIKESFYNNYNFSDKQIKSILDLKLQRLTNLEYKNLLEEYNDIINKIDNYIWILKDKKNIKEVIYKELLEIKSTYKDKRLTEIIEDKLLINKNELIKNFKVVITMSYHGYIKYQPLSDYQAQKRGGKGKSSTKIRSEDFINSLLVSYTHNDILLFSNKGRMFKMKVYQLPESSRGSKGKPISNIITIDKNERITAILSIDLNKLDYNNYIFMVTLKGFIKKTYTNELIKSRNSGFIVIKLNKKDELVGVNITNGNNDIMLFSENGKVVRFLEKQVRSTSRMSCGVKGMNLLNSDKIVSLIIPRNENDQILTITKNGFGKRTNKSEYPIRSRAIQGVISTKITEKSGKVIKSIKVSDNDQILIITDFGTLVRIRVSEIRISGRNTSGVKLIKVSKNENVVDLQRIIDDI